MILTLHRHLKVQTSNSNTTKVKTFELTFEDLVMNKREAVSSWLTKINFQQILYLCYSA